MTNIVKIKTKIYTKKVHIDTKFISHNLFNYKHDSLLDTANRIFSVLSLRHNRQESFYCIMEPPKCGQTLAIFNYKKKKHHSY